MYIRTYVRTYITVQELVKDVIATIYCMEISFLPIHVGGILNYNFIINPFSSDAYQSYNTLLCAKYIE